MLGTTIKQLADQIGCSKTEIRNKMDAEFREKHTFKDQNGVIRIDYDGMIILKKAFNAFGNSANQSETNTKNFTETPQRETEKFAESTANQVEITENQWYQKEIDRLHGEIERLHQLLDQEQKLHARTQERLLLLESHPAELDETAATQEESKKPWWKRFRKGEH